MTPTYIGKYKIQGELGQGAMGIVYKAYDESLERTVAIKTIHSHLLRQDDYVAALLKRFKTEAMAAARCQHANIVTVYEFIQERNMPFIVMEYVDGRELKDILKEKKSLSMQQINHIFLQVAKALHYAHQRGIVHRDIKPANIIWLRNMQVKVADFGIARIDQSDTTQVGEVLGTPSYMSPEQNAGIAVNQQADIYALGVVMFEMLASCPDLLSIMRTHPVTAILDLPVSKKLDYTIRFPKSLADFFEQCLAKEPSKRFASITQMANAYKQALQKISHIDQNTQSDNTAVQQAEEQWLTQRLEMLEKALIPYIGPIAKELIRSYRRESLSFDTLIYKVAEAIPHEKERQRFIHHCTTDHAATQSSIQKSMQAAPALETVFEATHLAQLKTVYSYYLGPIASILIKQQANKTSSWPVLIEALVIEIKSPSEQQDFIKKAKEILIF